MASIAAELKTYLKTKSTITDVVGSGDAARIYEQALKQNATLPAIVIRVFGGTSEQHLSAITGIAANRIEIECFAATPAAAYSLAELVRLAPLQAYRGLAGSTFIHSVTCEQGGYEDHDPPQRGTDARRYFHSRDYFISYSEATS